MRRYFAARLIILLTVVPLSAWAGPDFKVTATTVEMTEGGADFILLVETDSRRFTLSIPKGYGSETQADTRTIVFTSDVGASAITVRFSTNYAGALPNADKLRDQVAASYRTASLVASSAASTGFGPALSFELYQPAGKGLMLRIRDVYASYAEGSVELTFSCNNNDFDKQKIGFMRLLNSFRLVAKDDKVNP
jgi:hypothetical protein